MTPLFRKFLGLNWVVFLTMVGLLIFGVFAVYSASWMRTSEYLVNSYLRQINWIVLGFVVFFVTSLIDYRWVRYLAVPSYVLGLLCLIALRFIGEEKNQAVSWLPLPGGIGFQPSQVAIVAGILCLALLLGEMHHFHPVFRHHLLRLAVAGGLSAVPFFLIVLEPDVGSAFVWIPSVACILLVASIPFRYLIVITQLGLLAVPIAYWFVLKDYQKERIDTFKNMLTGAQVDERGAAWVPRHCVMAVGSAGWAGKGFKGQKLKRQFPDKKTITEMNGFIPATVAINDFIFAVIAEEQGFRGSTILITAYLLLLLQCLFIAFYSRDQLGRLLVAGIVGLFFAHIFLNIGMNILLVPVTGLPLPLISYGGTFIVICMFLLGLVQSVWIHRNDTSDSKPSLHS
ncbi:MAG: FtsW/RodA/SpoVE family cell cycle protein [Verrucomicrobiota bacterium]